MPCSAMKSRNVSWEDGDEKRGLRKSGHLPGVTHSSAGVQIACLNLVSRHTPHCRTDSPGRADPPPAELQAGPLGSHGGGTGVTAQHRCPYLKANEIFLLFHPNSQNV